MDYNYNRNTDYILNANLCMVISIFINLTIIINYNMNEFESMYINAIKKTWKNYPILDISLTKKDGYEKIILLNLESKNICDCMLVDDYQRIFRDSCNEYKI